MLRLAYAKQLGIFWDKKILNEQITKGKQILNELGIEII